MILLFCCIDATACLNVVIAWTCNNFGCINTATCFNIAWTRCFDNSKICCVYTTACVYSGCVNHILSNFFEGKFFILIPVVYSKHFCHLLEFESHNTVAFNTNLCKWYINAFRNLLVTMFKTENFIYYKKAGYIADWFLGGNYYGNE